MIKLYISIPIPEGIKKQLKTLNDDTNKCEWINKNNLHLTLRYVGEVNQKQYFKIKSKLKNIASSPFQLKLSNVGYFPHRKHPTSLWAGVKKSKVLSDLKHMIDDLLIEDDLESPPHKFRPHITLAKLHKVQYQDVSKFLKRNDLFESTDFEVNEFQLVSGHKGGDGIHYEIEQVYHLKAS